MFTAASAPRWPVLAIYAGTLGAFSIDLTSVNTLPFGFCYVPLVASAHYRKDKSTEWSLAAIASAMIFIGSFFPSLDPDTFTLAVNRAVSIAAVVGSATLVHHLRPAEELCDLGLPSTVLWERSNGAYYATDFGPSGEVHFFLMAEPAGEGWRWIAWRRGGSELAKYRGMALTVHQAMRDAEQAVGKRR